MTGLTDNIYLLAPEFALAGLALLIFAIDLVLPAGRKAITPWFTAAGLLGIIALSIAMLWDRQELLYGGLLGVDAFSLFFKVFFLGLGVFIVLISWEYVDRYLDNPGEYYGLLALSILGMNIMVQARELLTAYIALELLSFVLYVLTSHARRDPRSNEAGLKYILIGAFSSAVLLYGLSMVYSTIGVTQYPDIALALSASGQLPPALWVGIALLVVGLGFKVFGGALSHVGARRLRRRSLAGDRVPRDWLQGGRLRLDSEAGCRGIPAGGRPVGPVADSSGGYRRLDHAGRQPGGLGPAGYQAVDGLLQHRPRGVYPCRYRRFGSRLRPGHQRCHSLPGRLFGNQPGGFRRYHCVFQPHGTAANY